MVSSTPGSTVVLTPFQDNTLSASNPSGSSEIGVVGDLKGTGPICAQSLCFMLEFSIPFNSYCSIIASLVARLCRHHAADDGR